jgi:hypothetical protein
VPVEPVRGEDLVPVVADPPAVPAVSAAAGQAHRVGVGRSEEWLSRGRSPVEQQPATLVVGEAEAPDVDGVRVVGVDDVTEAEVQAEAAQSAQSGGDPVDLHVAVHRALADAAGGLSLDIEAFGQLGDRLLEAVRDRCEMLLVGGDEGWVGFGGEVVGKVKCAGSQGVHPICSDLRSATIDRNFGAHEGARFLLQRKWRDL